MVYYRRMRPTLSTINDSDIVLRLGHYDDIFSVFDIRPYTHRSLSEDFLSEIKRASADKEDAGITLLLHVPKKKRHEGREQTIRERLARHFRKHYQLLRQEKQRIMGRGLVMVILGMICMVIATLILYQGPSHDLMQSFLIVFLEPAAWFLLWEGMDQIIFNSQKVNPDLAFYRKMSHSKVRIHFKSY